MSQRDIVVSKNDTQKKYRWIVETNNDGNFQTFTNKKLAVADYIICKSKLMYPTLYREISDKYGVLSVLAIKNPIK